MVSPFLFLAVDLPPPPLFQDSVEKNIIPQVSIHSILAKYDGTTTQVSPRQTLPFRMINNLGVGVGRTVTPIQMPTPAAIYHFAFQTLYQKCFRGRKKSNHRQFPVTGFGL